MGQGSDKGYRVPGIIFVLYAGYYPGPTFDTVKSTQNSIQQLRVMGVFFQGYAVLLNNVQVFGGFFDNSARICSNRRKVLTFQIPDQIPVWVGISPPPFQEVFWFSAANLVRSAVTPQ